MRETAVCNVLIAQVGRRTVPNTWPGYSKVRCTYTTCRAIL